MANALHLNRRLLSAVLRSPPVTFTVVPYSTPLSLRTLSSSTSRRNNAFSVSFGAETDRILAQNGSSVNNGGKDRTLPEVPTTRRPANTRSNSSTSDRHESRDEHTGIEPVLLDIPDPSRSGQDQPSGASKKQTKKSRTNRDPSLVSSPQSKNLREQRSGDQKSSGTGLRMQDSKSPRGQSVEKSWSRPPRKLEGWEIQKGALREKFGEEGWNPRKKLSPDAIEGIRELHEQDPERYSTAMLANQFKMSPEAIRRILRSKWKPSPEKMDERRARWARRHDRIWDQKAALGLRPPRTRDKQPDGPEAFDEEVKAKQILGEM